MNEEQENRWPGFTDEAHPDVFTTVPRQPAQLKIGQLSEDQIRKFFNEGFLLLESFFKPEELDPGKVAIDNLVDELANKLFDGGKITNLYKEYGYDKRLTMIEKEFPGANIIMHKLGRLPKAFQEIWSNERLMNVAEQILGTCDIIGHPVWNLRTKTPNSEATTVPWHQDVAYLDKRSYSVLQLTAWIPMINATKETGCMQVVRSGHRTGRVATHTCCSGDTWYVMLSEEEIRKKLECDLERDVVTVPVSYGSVLLLNNLLPHRSLNNISDCIRWSLDFRWQRADRSPGFYDIKQGVRMRSADPHFEIDWNEFMHGSRHDAHVEKPDFFVTTIAGPWMLNWEMTHTNRHTESMKKGDITSWHMILS